MTEIEEKTAVTGFLDSSDVGALIKIFEMKLTSIVSNMIVFSKS